MKTRDVESHLLSILKGRPNTYTGHNPVGAWMIEILLALLSVIVLSGLIVLGSEENLGPLASIISSLVGDVAEDFHEAIAGILMTAIGYTF